MATITISRPTTLYPSLPTDQEWPAQGHWTYDDFLRLPDDGNRYEIIDGVLYVTGPCYPPHQLVVGEIMLELSVFTRNNHLGTVLPGPIEVHLPGIATPVQPDVLFVAQARRDIVKAKFIEGAPDLIVEVLSPSTVRTDRKIKFDAYERAGVREYWIANPKTRSVEVYTLSGSEYALHGEFGAAERLTSRTLAGFETSVDALFAS